MHRVRNEGRDTLGRWIATLFEAGQPTRAVTLFPQPRLWRRARRLPANAVRRGRH